MTGRPCRIVSLATEEPELRCEARDLFDEVGVRPDDGAGEDLYEACVAPDGRVVGASTLGLYDEQPDDADDLRRPRWRFSVVVDEAARRQGIAKALVESIIRAHPRERFLLEGKVVNPHMATLLKGLGFYYETGEDEVEWGEHERAWGHRMYRPNPRGDARTEFYRLLVENGAVLLRQKNHMIYKLPSGQRVVAPKTASDWRAWKNALAHLKRTLKSGGQARPNPPARDDHRYRFVTSCIDSTYEDIQALKAGARQIARPTFVRKLAPGEWAQIQQTLGFGAHYPITRDRLIGYYRSTFRGVPAVFLAWSGIEYVFTLDGKIGASAARDARWNPDDRLRNLERAAAQGDPAAARALRREQARAGAHVPADVLIADAILDGDLPRAQALRHDLQVRSAEGDAAAERALRRVLAHEWRGQLLTDQCHQLLEDAIEEGEFVRIHALAQVAARTRLGGIGSALGCPYPNAQINLFQYPGLFGRCGGDPTFYSALRSFSPDPARATPGVLAGHVPPYGFLVHVEDGASREVRDRLHDLATNAVYRVLGMPRPWSPGDVEAALRFGRGFDPQLDEERFRQDWARLSALPAKRAGGQNPPDDELRRLERLASQGDRDALLALHAARRRAGVPETGEQALEYLIASGAAVRVASNEFGNTQQLLARIGCGYLGDGAASPDGMWWSRGHPDAERQLPGAWARFYRDWVVVLDEDVDPTISARLAALRTPAQALAHMVASFPGRLPSLARALERARGLSRTIRLRTAPDRSSASRAWAEMTPSEEAEFAAEWRRFVERE